MLLKLVRRNVAANKGRLFLTLLSIVLGVAFVSGSFLLADSLRAIFTGISEQAFAGVDAQIRTAQNELSEVGELARFTDDVLDDIEGLPEVEYAEGGLGAFEQIFTVDENGDPRRPLGPPVISASWGGPSPASSFNIVEGTGPVGAQVAIDTTQAEAGELAVGDITDVALPSGGIEQFEVSGIVTFGDAAAGAYFNLFDLPTMQRMLPDAEGLVDSVVLNAAAGVSNAELIGAVEEALGFDPQYEVVAGTTLIDEQNDAFGSFIDIIGYVLLGFAVVVLFVSIFIIYNTFAILIGQRIRQFGLLRSVGATGTQLRVIVLIESVVIGILAAILGLLGGIVIAWLLKQLFAAAAGGQFPDGPIIFAPRTIIVVSIVGILVTVLSAIIPAWRAARIPPLAALQGANLDNASRGRRLTIGLLVLLPGLGMLLFGLFGSFDGVAPRLGLLGIGAALSFIGVALMSVLFASAASRFIGQPVEAARGIRGRLARDNASRNPQRTAATATALMIGLALITGVAIMQQSIRATLTKLLDDAVAADIFVFEEQTGIAFAGTAVEQLEAIPEIDRAAGVSTIKVFLDGEVAGATGFDTSTGDSVLNIGLTSGKQMLGANGVLVFDEKADDLGLGVGDTVEAEFEDGFTDTFTIEGIFDDKSLMQNDWVFDRSVSRAHIALDSVDWVGATFADGTDPAVAQAAAEESLANFPQLGVQNNREFREGQESQINGLLYLIGGLLALCIVVAFIGIVNTMALSVLERTREIGLLRAVGTSKKQLRSAVRWEAVIVSIFGAVLGVLMGLLFGWAAVVAIPDSFVSEVAIPWWISLFVIAGALLGVVAAVFPARRAANLNVLDAIS